MVAESFGGWVALWLAAKHPDLVEHLVLARPGGICATKAPAAFRADPEGRMRALYAHPGARADGNALAPR